MTPDYKAICDRWGIELHEGPQEGWDEDSYTNCSSCAGSDEIFLGVYEDPELRMLSFFHELGHCVSAKLGQIPDYEDLPYYHYSEALAWQVGLSLASTYNIEFSPKALTWAKEQLGSYFRDGSPEATPLKHLPQALEDAGLV